jgi:serine/threonine protein kinase
MLPEGTTISGHRIVGFVGEGGMATVYEALQVSLERTVALKVVAQRIGDDPAFRERFRRECYIQAQLDHPNIVPIYEAGESDYGLWLTMRLVRGPTLRELLLEERLTASRALALLAPIARAVDVAHEHGLVHRDITPQNVLIDERDHPYLSDFGITKGRGDRSLTKTGQFVGTLDYVAPEQIRDEPSEAPTDTYALAAILFECLTGRVPFEKGSEAAVLYAHIAEDPPRASGFESSLPAAVDDVLRRGLAKQPADRYATAIALIEAAEEALRSPVPPPVPSSTAAVEDPTRDPAATPSSPPTSGGGRLASWRRVSALAFVVLLLAALGVAIGATIGGGSASDPHRVTAGDLVIDLPSGWVVQRRGSGSVPGLPLTNPATLLPASQAGGESVIVGVSPASGETLLTPALRRTVRGPVKGTPVLLGSLEALRYPNLREPGGATGLAAFVAPVESGVATVVCRPYLPGTDFAELCQRLAATLELRRGRAFPLGPSPSLEVVLRHQLARLDQRRATFRRRLAAAGGADQQATAASGLAEAFRQAARGLSGRQVTPQSAAGLAALVEGLRTTRDAYKNLATAARREDAAGYDSATIAVGRGEATVDRRLRAMRRLGYRVGASG